MSCRLPRFLALTVGIVAVPVTLAWGNPSLSERAFALTGATGVCIVCYIIPIVVHFLLLFPCKAHTDRVPSIPAQNGGEDSMASSAAARWLLEEETLQSDGPEESSGHLHTTMKRYAPRPGTLWEWAGQALVPAAVLMIGCILSVLALVNSKRPDKTAA